MAKPRITKDVKDKKLIELEGVTNNKYNYFIRLDGARFREFRVQKRSYEELKLYDSIMKQLCKDILARYKFVRFIFYHDDEINILFKGSELHMKRRIQKNLSLITSFVSVRFNSLLRDSDLYKIQKVNREYYFDARFVEMKNQISLKDYIAKRMSGVRFQVINLLTNVLEVSNTQDSINKLINKYLLDNDRLEKYRSIFGYYITRCNEGEILEDFSEFVLRMQNEAINNIL